MLVPHIFKQGTVHQTLTVPLSTQQYKGVLAKYCTTATKCWGLACGIYPGHTGKNGGDGERNNVGWKSWNEMAAIATKAQTGRQLFVPHVTMWNKDGLSDDDDDDGDDDNDDDHDDNVHVYR